nr:ATP-binding protein [Micromonospora sp. DH13]
MVLNELLLNAVEHGFPPAAESPTGPPAVPTAGSSAGSSAGAEASGGAGAAGVGVGSGSAALAGASGATGVSGSAGGSGSGGGSGLAEGSGSGGVLPQVAAGVESTVPPEVVVSAHRFRKQLHVTVADNGRGLPAGFDAERGSRLGLQIVRALVTGELRGTIELRNGAEGGTEAVLVVPLVRS